MLTHDSPPTPPATVKGLLLALPPSLPCGSAPVKSWTVRRVYEHFVPPCGDGLIGMQNATEVITYAFPVN